MTMGIKFDNGPDESNIAANSLPSEGSFLSKIGRKYFKITSPDVTRETLHDKFKLINFITVKYTKWIFSRSPVKGTKFI